MPTTGAHALGCAITHAPPQPATNPTTTYRKRDVMRGTIPCTLLHCGGAGFCFGGPLPRLVEPRLPPGVCPTLMAPAPHIRPPFAPPPLYRRTDPEARTVPPIP